ncbi:MAG: glycosyltransferase [Lachnospiraceae bacterium]|nr:glycosyltransferase [Lachnospiraceae bacterium]
MDSIVSQDYQNIDLVLVNDSSNDDSLAIVESYAQKDNRIRIVTVPHGGVSVARNQGLEVAAGEYVMFVDADDWIGEGILGHMMETLRESRADLVTCNIKHMAKTEDGVMDYQDGFTVYDQEEYKRIFFRIGTNQYVHYPVAKIYKKDSLPKPLYPPNIRVGEDVLGTYRAICNAQTIAWRNEIGYYYSYSPESATASFGEKDFDLLSVWDMMVEESKGKEPDHSYATLDRKRLDFTLLFRLITEVPPKERKQKYSKQEKQLRKDLKNNKKELLYAPIVRSRKILIFMLCHFYPIMSLVGNVYIKLCQIKHRPAVGQRRNLS